MSAKPEASSKLSSIRTITESHPSKTSNTREKQSLIQKYTGFTTFFVLTLCLLTTGVFSLFSIVQFQFLKRNGEFDMPLTSGERFWYLEIGRGRWLNQLHLWTVAPAGTLLPLQFFPIIRRKLPQVHRWLGYSISTLILIGSLTGFQQGVHAFGGTASTRLYTFLIGVGSTYGTIKSVTAARRYNFDVHRAWALRTWSFATSILALRLILVPLVIYYSETQTPGPMSFLTCAEVIYLRSTHTALTSVHLESTPNATIANLYPACLPVLRHLSLPADTLRWIRNNTVLLGTISSNVSVNESSSARVIDWPTVMTYGKGNLRVPVQARMRFPEEITAFFRLIFGWCGLAGLVVHVLAVEIWIWWTKSEAERLKKVGEMRKRAELRKGE